MTKGTGGGIAGIFEGLFPFLLLPFHQSGEALPRHIYFAPDNDTRNRTGQLLRDGTDSAQIMGNVLAHLTVAPGSAPDKPAVHIFQRDGQSIDFRFHHINRRFRRFTDAAVELPQLLQRKNVLQAFQRRLMANRGKLGGNRPLHPLGIGIRRYQLRISAFQSAKLPGQRVEFIILDGRRVLLIIKTAVFVDLRPQFLYPAARFL